jgi:hypothetical protein
MKLYKIAVPIFTVILLLSLIIFISFKANSKAEIHTYLGSEIDIPDEYRVVDAKKTTCQKLYEKVVYLGIVESEEDCPARAIGDAAIILTNHYIEGSKQLKSGSLYKYIEGGSTLRRGSDINLMASSSQFPEPIARAPKYSTYLGFDTCAAPTLEKLRVWKQLSPYNTIGIYIGGKNKGCFQRNLNRNYLAQVVAMGYHLIPIYVGEQAPCMKSPTRVAKIVDGEKEGDKEANDAIYSAKMLGLVDAPIYSDIEYFNTKDKACTDKTTAYIGAFHNRLKINHYNYGVYSSMSGISNLLDKNSTELLWIAKWDRSKLPNFRGGKFASFAPNYIKQYRGGHSESYGKMDINIDNNIAFSYDSIW